MNTAARRTRVLSADLDRTDQAATVAGETETNRIADENDARLGAAIDRDRAASAALFADARTGLADALAAFRRTS